MAKYQTWKGIVLFFLCFVLSGPSSIAGNKVKKKIDLPLYKDKSAPIDKRVEDLLMKMTLHEKILQMENVDVHNPNDIEKVFKGESYGSVHEMQKTAAECAVIFQAVQKYCLEKTRLGIPIIAVVEGIQGILQNGCTIFPHSLAIGSTFNTALMGQMTQAAGEEGLAIGVHQVLSPCLDIARELRWGRVEETYGEDPFLIAEMGIAFINGYKKNNIICTPKHFVAHGSPSGGLNCANVSGGERELRSLYLYPFRRVIAETNPMSLMSCYSSYDGIASVGSSYYMTDILRNDLEFKGYVYSDWGSVEHLKSFHHVAETNEDAAKLAVEAGVDLDIDSDYYLLEKMVEQGKVDVKYIDRAVKRILTVKFGLGLFENPYGQIEKLKDVVHSKSNIELSRTIASESVILLKNERDILPLTLSKYKSIALIGPNANQTIFGDYSWPANKEQYGVNLLEGLKSKVGNNVTINYAEGCDWWSQNKEGFDEAISAVEKSDIAIIAIGTRSLYLGRNPEKVTSGEGFDLSSLQLPGVQEEMIKRVKATGKPFIVVFISGKPLAIPWIKENADAILVQWYGGEQQGNVLADILLGQVNPSGKLNVSFPRSTGNSPCFYNYLPTDRGHFGKGGSPEKPEGHYIFEQPYALWPFGYGLSYTRFKYIDCDLNSVNFTDKDTISITVDIQNIGTSDGKEVVQAYVRDKISSVATPVKQLKAFKKVLIKSGNTAKVVLQIPISELALYNAQLKRVVEPGEFELQIGSSSDDIFFKKTITVK